MTTAVIATTGAVVVAGNGPASELADMRERMGAP